MQKDVLLEKAVDYFMSFGASDKYLPLISKWVEAVVLFDSECKGVSLFKSFNGDAIFCIG